MGETVCVYLTLLYLTEHLRMIQSPTAVCIQVCSFDGENDSSVQAGVQECVLLRVSWSALVHGYL